MARSAWLAGLGLSLLLTSACASPRAPRVNLPPDDLWKLYREAVEAAKHPEPSRISTRLVPILQYTPRLRWDAEGRVLMSTWTKGQYYKDSVGKPYTFSHGPVWLTAVPFVQDFCRSLRLPPDRLSLRLEQLLGLPPDAGYDAFVQLWIDPEDFFRPCADPEVTDRECTLNLTADRSPRDACPWAGSFQGQVSSTWVTVTQSHLDWMCTNWTGSYQPKEGPPYPWTGLGYTWDWGQPNPVGQSEFVAPQGTTVVIESVTPTAEYCRR